MCLTARKYTARNNNTELCFKTEVEVDVKAAKLLIAFIRIFDKK